MTRADVSILTLKRIWCSRTDRDYAYRNLQFQYTLRIFCFRKSQNMLARFSILPSTPSMRAREHKNHYVLFVLSDRIELSSSAPQADVLSIERREQYSKCISEPEQPRHKVGERVRVFFFVNVVQKIFIDHVNINPTKRNDEMRREPALSLDGKHGGEFVLYIF